MSSALIITCLDGEDRRTDEALKDMEKEMHGQVEKIAQALNIDLRLHTIPCVMGARWA